MLVVACAIGPTGANEATMSTGATGTSTSEASPTDTIVFDTQAFGPVLDFGLDYVLCDLVRQDCPEGQKCNPSAYGTGSVWSGARICVPVVPDANPPYAPCSLLGSERDGTDDCVLGSTCFGNGGNDGDGTCSQLCNVDGLKVPACPAEEECYEPGCAECSWGICRRPCDPRELESCPLGQECLPGNPLTFECFGDLSGDGGQAGDLCEFVNVCDPGLLCLDPQRVPGCDGGAVGCCSPFCSTDEPNMCPGQDQGAVCVPFFDEGEVPLPQFANLGTCSLPPP